MDETKGAQTRICYVFIRTLWRNLIKEETIVAMVTSVLEDIKDTIRLPQNRNYASSIDALAKLYLS
jgi:ubiquitin-protein ligase